MSWGRKSNTRSVVSLIFFPTPVFPGLSSVQPETLKWVLPSMQRAPGKALSFWLEDQEKGHPLLQVSCLSSVFFPLFSILLHPSPKAIMCWQQQKQQQEHHGRQEPAILKEGTFLSGGRRHGPWGWASPSLSCWGSTQALTGGTQRGEGNTPPAFWPENWKREPQGTGKSRNDHRGRRESTP